VHLLRARRRSVLYKRDMASSASPVSHGILVPSAVGRHFTLRRHAPSADLAGIIDRFWIVRWDLRGPEGGPREQATLPFPAVNVVVGDHQPGVFGPTSARFVAKLQGAGSVFGVKFRPAGFRGLLAPGLSARDLVDRSCAPAAAFVDGPAAAAWVERVEALASGDDDAATTRVRLTEALVRAHHRGLVKEDDEVNQIVELARSDTSLTRVASLATRAGVGVRCLERLVRAAVGVPPKWILRRFRVQEAAARLAANDAVDLPGLALDLGYTDQPHFIRDFRAQTGYTPARYAALCLGRTP
jgi:AraC-like DNA-binding protein